VPGQKWPRRRFIGTAAAAVLAGPALVAACDGDDGPATGAATTSTGPGTSGTGAGGSGEPNLFRLSTRHNRHPCIACKTHAANRYYASAAAAAADRAHPGCNCEVRAKVVDDGQLETFFGGGRRTVYDERSA
jgi:hypothetical protein